MTLRNRKKVPLQGASDIIRELDSFSKPKPEIERFIQRSRIGGTISIIAHVVILWIMVSELRLYFFDSYLDFKFVPDTDYNAKLKLKLDITVAMPCHAIGADILDSTHENMHMFGSLEEEDVWFQMSPDEQQSFNDMRLYNSYLREEFHAVHELLWKSGQSFIPSALSRKRDHPHEQPDACRIYGTLEVNKVAGNFHITVGKSFQLADSAGHIHISPWGGVDNYNFSHRIHHFSFGDSSIGIIHPLDGDEKIATDPKTLYQYFIEVVPTDVQTFRSQTTAYQYSVKDNMRIINHSKGSHGMSGIMFKYDMSALKVIVTQAHEPLFQFLIRLFSTVAGVFVTAGLLRDLIVVITEKIHIGQLKLASTVQENHNSHCCSHEY